MKKQLTLISLVLSLFSFDSYSQIELLNLQKKIDQYHQNLTQTKIYLFFNQPAYSAGDTAFFVARLVDSKTNIAVLGKNILGLRLIGVDGTHAVEQKFFVENGNSSNQIVLPENLPHGVYHLVAWSSVPQNGTINQYYQQEFFVLNEKQIIYDTSQKLSVKFFPEGGHLIAMVSNHLVVEVSPPQILAGVVLDQDKIKITEFVTNKFGLGEFILEPKDSSRYQVVFSAPYEKEFIPVPKAELDGLAMRINHSDPEKLAIEIKVPAQSNFQNEYLTLVATNRGKIFYSLSVNNLFPSSIKIPTNEIPLGLSEIILIDSKSNLLATRLIYSHPAKLNFIHCSTEARTRSRVNLKIKIPTPFNKLKGVLTLRIYQDSLFKRNEHQKNIVDELLLHSDLPRNSYRPERHIETDSKESLDRFLISQTSNNNWKNLLKEVYPRPFLPIGETLQIPGKATNKISGTPLKDLSFLTFYFQKTSFIQNAYVQDSGRFLLKVSGEISQVEKVFYKADYLESELPQVSLQFEKDNFPMKGVSVKLIENPDPYSNYLKIKRASDLSYKYFEVKKSQLANTPLEPHKLLEEETLGVNAEYQLSEYKVFNSMEELIVEILPKVLIKRYNGRPAVRMLLEEWGKSAPVVAKQSPIYSIDGIMTNDAEFFLNLKPNDIDKIKLIWKVENRRTLGSIGSNGIILVETKIPGFREKVPSTNTILISGVSEAINYSANKVSHSSERRPDLRPTLYWNPAILINEIGEAAISFTTSDDLGDYIIEAEGLLDDGSIIYEKLKLRVKPNDN